MSFLRTILDALIAPREPVSENLKQRERDNALLLERSVYTDVNGLMAGAVDSVVGGTIVDTNPTSGQIFEDDEYNDRYLHFLSGALFTANNFNRYKITATSFASKSLSVAEDLQALGAVATNTYAVMGQSHSGTVDDDGEKIDFKNLINRAEGAPMTQDLANAILDPDNVRSEVADRTSPFVSTAEASINYTNNFVWVDSGVDVGLNIVSDLSSIVPVGTKFVQTYIRINATGAFSVQGREVSTGTFRDVLVGSLTDSYAMCVLLPVDSSRQIETGLGGSFSAATQEVRSYQK